MIKPIKMRKVFIDKKEHQVTNPCEEALLKLAIIVTGK
jgi:hypothetical protein